MIGPTDRIFVIKIVATTFEIVPKAKAYGSVLKRVEISGFGEQKMIFDHFLVVRVVALNWEPR